MKQLIIVENETQLNQACAAAVSNPTAHFAAASPKLGMLIKQRGYICVPFYPEDVFAERSEVDAFEAEVWSLARSWYRRDALSEPLAYGAYSLGGAVELYMGNALIWTLRNWIWLKKLCQKESPDEIICFAESKAVASQFFPRSGEAFVAKMARQLGYKVVVRSKLGRPKAPDLAVKAKEWARVCMRLAYQTLQRPSPKTGRPKVLVASAPHHVRSVMLELKKDHEVIYLDEAFRAAKLDFFLANQIPYFSYPEIQSQIPPDAKLRLAALRARMDQLEAGLSSTLSASGAFLFRGEDMAPLVSDKVRFFAQKAACEAATYYEAFRQFIIEHEIKAVLVDEDTVTFRKSLVTAARECGIPSFQIPHGVSLSDFHYDLFPVSSDRVLAASSGIKHYYEDQGVSADVIDVVGIPRYDELVTKFGEASRLAMRKQLGLLPSEKVVLFAPTVSFDVSIRLRPAEAEAMLRRFAKAMREIPAKLIVKFHPLDTECEQKKEVFREMGLGESVFIQEGDAALLAAASDLVVSFASNLAIECLAFGQPVLWLDAFSLSSSHVPYLASAECDFKIGTGEDLKPRLKAALSASRTSSIERHKIWFQKNWVGELDGRAGMRCAQVIREALCAVRH